jgi:hypothetical protein
VVVQKKTRVSCTAEIAKNLGGVDAALVSKVCGVAGLQPARFIISSSSLAFKIGGAIEIEKKVFLIDPRPDSESPRTS